jgi:uncharacterized membrane protein YecN with MAPEG domain
MPPKTRAEKTSRGDSPLWAARKSLIVATVVGLVFLVVTQYGFNQWGHRYVSVPHLHSLTDRIVWTLRYQVLGLSALLWSVGHVFVNRSVAASVNPLTGHDSSVERASRVLTNTLEQFVLNAVNQLILSTYLSESNLRLIPLLSVYFLLGRIAYWIGYQIAPKHRYFGFTLTFWPTVVVFTLNAYFLLTTNTNYLFDGGKPFGRI